MPRICRAPFTFPWTSRIASCSRRSSPSAAAHLEPPRSRVEILMPQRGAKHAFLELVEKNARHSFEQRFRVLKPSSKAIVEALEQALSLPEPPRRIESFDISHLQGSDTVASMVVWEDGRMKKSDYRKFIIRGEWGNDDFASMREIDRAALPPAAGGKEAVSQPDPDRRRTRPAPRGGGGAGKTGSDQSEPSPASPSRKKLFMSSGRKISPFAWSIIPRSFI